MPNVKLIPEHKALTLPYRSLGIFVPKFDLDVAREATRCDYPGYGELGDELVGYVRSQGVTPVGRSVRRLTAANWKKDAAFGVDDVICWHRDSSDCRYEVVWASQSPTRLRWRGRDGEWVEWQPAPYEMVLFDNHQCEHRAPATIDGVRWFFRAFTDTP